MSTPQDPQGGDRDWPGQRPSEPPQGPQPAGSYPGDYPGTYPSEPPSFGSYPSYPSRASGNQQQYGGYPPTPPTPTRRPGLVVAAAVLWVVAGLFAIFGGVDSALRADDEEVLQDFTAQFEERGVDISQDMLESALVVTGVIVAVLGLLAIAFSLLMLKRQNWARVLVTIVGVLVGLMTLGTIVAPLAVIVAIVLQFLPQSNMWFRTRPRHDHVSYGS